MHVILTINTDFNNISAMKTNGKVLERKLLQKKESGWLEFKFKDLPKLNKFSGEYIDFLNKAKTERETVAEISRIAQEFGFKAIEDSKTEPKIFAVNRGKSVALAVIGSDDVSTGFNIIAAHIDAPRLDIKQNPLYEYKDGALYSNLAFLKTHYYGGVKKYHWVNIPLALHGKIIRKDGKEINFVIGEKENDPVFVIADLLPHLSKKIQDKKIDEAIPAENLNIIVGNMAIPDRGVIDRVKLAVMKILNERYGLVETDFNSAEIEAVPALRARVSGIDESMIAGYGQDDRICTYAALRAICGLKTPKKTCIAVFVDKEEIGSEGTSSIQSVFFENFVSDLVEKIKGANCAEKTLKQILSASCAISADVEAAFDPTYREVFDERNAAKLGNGISITKYTGSGGKYAASDASAEYVGKLRKLFLDNKIVCQFSELGKVDEGGGGTIAKYLAEYGMEIIDCGVPLLGMHSTYEVSSKFDLYQTYLAYSVFFSKMK